jgi:hypothetical protein
LAENRIGHSATAAHRIDFIEARLDKLADTDPAYAAAVRAEVMRGLSPTEQAELQRREPGITRDAGGGQTTHFSTTTTLTQDQWIDQARAGNYRDYAIYARLAGANDNASIGRAMDDVFAGRITPSQFAAAGAAVDAAGGPGGGQFALDLLQMSLDLTGIVDPTPISDGSNAVISLGRSISSLFSGEWSAAGGHLVNGAISVIGFVPALGDLAKAGKIGKWAQTVADAISTMSRYPAMAERLRPILREIHDLVNRIPQSALEALPASARESLQRMKTQLDEVFGTAGKNVDGVAPTYKGKVRGQEFILEGVETHSVNYVKRDRTEYANLRKAFDGGARADFAKSLTSSPEGIAALKRAGLDDAQIARLKDGKVPQGWQVHHKLPLDDGGTNDFSNLVLIKNDPYHIALTNAQKALVGDLAVGGSRQVDFPIPKGSIYHPK